MATGERTPSNVLVFDETPEQQYLGPIREGVKMAGGIALPFDDPKIALEDFDSTVNALVATLAPLSTDPIGEFPAVYLALIGRAHELKVPLGIVTMQSSAVSLMRPESYDAIFDSYPSRTDLLPGQITRWLGRASLRYYPQKFEISENNQKLVKNGPAARTAGFLLGGEARMQLGIWIANTDAGVGEISAPQLAEMTGMTPISTAKTLQLFCQWGLLEAADKTPGIKAANYRKVSSPLWEIYKVARRAINALNAQTDKPN